MSAPKSYTFLSPGDIMAEGDEMIEPWFTWAPIPKRNIGNPVTAKGAPRVRRPNVQAPALVEAAKALHDALSNILEGCNSPERHMDGITNGEMYSWIHRDQRALAHWAIRKSFKVLYPLPGGLE